MGATNGLFDMGPHMHPDDREPGHTYVSGSPFYPGHHDPLYHADFCGNNHAEDARLYIAAPDLLAALETLASIVNEETTKFPANRVVPAGVAYAASLAAIAKAKGE